MKSFLIAVAFLAAQSTAYAQTLQGATALYEVGSDRNEKSAAAAPRMFNGVRNANECAPGLAEPVWSPTSVLLGYACTHSANGG